ncbi:hypothetical protein BH11BAC4_BH11BAC4_01940 [soil metagenome]
MKKIFLYILLLSATNSFAQSLEQQLQKIQTYEQAEQLIGKYPNAELNNVQVNSSIDTSALYKKFLSKKIGDIFRIGKDIYKVLTDTFHTAHRVNYIFLDGSKLSTTQIDSVRKHIISEYEKGVTFEALSAKYNMDGNQNSGDTNWFTEDVMVKEFSDAVKMHRTSEIFTVDVNNNNWFYVVRKTFETQQFRQMSLIRIQNSE